VIYAAERARLPVETEDDSCALKSLTGPRLVVQILLDWGLGFDAVVGCLVAEIGMSAAEATRATTAAKAERLTRIR
jgi:hypothetical protein